LGEDLIGKNGKEFIKMFCSLQKNPIDLDFFPRIRISKNDFVNIKFLLKKIIY